MKHIWRYFFVFVVLFLAISVHADTLGQNQQFFISSQYDIRSQASVAATLRHVSDRAYFYVADDYWDGVSVTTRGQIIDQIKLLAQEFDNRIYPTETQFFGSEPNPGIDGDTRITILLAPLIKNAGGYFDITNQYPVKEAPNSNQREIIYLNISELANQNKIFPFLAHEFQHLISFNQKENLRHVSDDIWINELRSEYAVTLLGYNNVFVGSHLERRMRAIQDDPADSLTEWKNLPADYGQIGMFGQYVAEHWSPRVIADTLKNNLKSIPSINDALSQNGFSDTFTDLYRDWLIADFLNDISSDNRFGYTGEGLNNFRVSPSQTINNLGDDTSSSIADTIRDWQGRWYDISQLIAGQKNVLKISFNSSSLASFYVSYVVFNAGGKYEVRSFNPIPNSNTFYITGIGTNAERVVVMPIKKDKLSGFSANEPAVQLTTTFERVDTAPDGAELPSLITSAAPALTPTLMSDADLTPDTKYQLPNTNFPGGSLVRARGDYKVYIIKGNWRRHIINSRIFNFYSGLGFDKVQEVNPSVLNQYQESTLIRYAADKRVYIMNKNGTRQWLNITPQQFTASGRSWDAVFTINLKELQFYRLGSNITK